MALNMNSMGIPGEFRVNVGFSGKLGVWGGFGQFGASKGFCANSQIANLDFRVRHDFRMDSAAFARGNADSLHLALGLLTGLQPSTSSSWLAYIAR